MEELNHIKKQSPPEGLYQTIISEIKYRRENLTRFQSMMILIPVCALSFSSIYMSNRVDDDPDQNDVSDDYSQIFKSNQLYHE